MSLSYTAALDLEVVDPLVDERWDREVSLHPEGSVFHESSWARVLCETYGHNPVYLRIHDGNDLLALIPFMELESWPRGKRGVGLPFSDWCSPLVFQKGRESDMIQELENFARGRTWRYLELRGTLPVLEGAGQRASSTFSGHELPLQEDEEAQFLLLSGAARRSVRKAQGSGSVATISDCDSSMRKFFRLHERTRRRHGVPPQSWAFFENIHRTMIATGRGFVSLVEKGGVPIAAAVFLFARQRAIYKFGASDERSLETRPNHLAIWEAIRALISQNCERLDFGRTSRSQAGLRRFKASWGARETEIVYSRCHLASGEWSTVPEDARINSFSGFRFMPLPINRWAGRMLYSHLD